MEKEKLPPIPTPASQRWREFRIRVLPLIVFAGVLAAIVMLWRSFVQPVGIVGLADTNAVNIVASQDGLLSTLTIDRFEWVAEGQIIGEIISTDPDLLKAQIASAKADIEVLRERNKVDQDRTEQSYQQFRQALFVHRFAQATDRVNWVVISNDFERATREFKTNLISIAQYEVFKVKLDALTTNIVERALQMTDLNATLEELQSRRKNRETDAFDKALEAKSHELDLMLKPTKLKAPISGIVSFVYHRAGERLLRSMPIVTITQPQATQIVGYMRQPIQSQPTTNDMVQVTTRSTPRQMGFTTIVRVGAQLEPINPAMLSAETKRMEVGLPIVVPVPPLMKILPGEFVDIAIVKRK